MKSGSWMTERKQASCSTKGKAAEFLTACPEPDIPWLPGAQLIIRGYEGYLGVLGRGKGKKDPFFTINY